MDQVDVRYHRELGSVCGDDRTARSGMRSEQLSARNLLPPAPSLLPGQSGRPLQGLGQRRLRSAHLPLRVGVHGSKRLSSLDLFRRSRIARLAVRLGAAAKAQIVISKTFVVRIN